MKTHKDLEVWQKSVDLVTDIYGLTKSFPKEEIFGITNQLRRAAVSIPANIAEGSGRNTTGELKQFIGIAMGSLAELETLVLISSKLGYLNDVDFNILQEKLTLQFRLLSGLKHSLK